MKPQTKFTLGPIFRPLSILALMVLVAAIPQTIDAQSEPQAAQNVYLPLIVYSPIEASGCQLTAEEQQVLNLLKEHPSPYIKEKITFAKRLAQCLNPLLPLGIHL